MRTEDIEKCARCAGAHTGLEFKLLTRPLSPPEVFWAWEYWAPCPTNGEPVLFSLSYAYLTGKHKLPAGRGKASEDWHRWYQERTDESQRKQFPDLYK